MTLSKRHEYHKIVHHNGTISVRRVDVIEEDGVAIATQNHRHVVTPGEDVTGQHHTVAAIANALWTAELIAEYQASLPSDPADDLDDPDPVDEPPTDPVDPVDPIDPPSGPSYEEVKLTIPFDSETATQVYGGGDPAVSDPNGMLTGWLYNNTGGKAHWYLYSQDPTDPAATAYTLGDIQSLFFQLRDLSTTGETRIPHINIYTLPLGDGSDAASWYRSRITYEVVNPEPGLMVDSEQFITWINEAPQLYTDQPQAQLTVADYASAGPQDLTEMIMLIAVSTDSAAELNAYNFALDKFGFITTDNRYLCIETTSQSDYSDQASYAPP